MKTKTKIIVSIASLCLVVVAAVVSIVTVFALINNSVNIGGSISFTAKNIYATVSAGTLSGGTLEDAGNKLKQIDYNASNDGSSALATWSDLNLTFPESGDDVTITFTVTNHSVSDALRVAVGDLSGTAENATMAISITGKDTGVRSAVIPAKAGATASSIELVITFHIVDKNSSASIENFNIPLTLEYFDGYDITLSVDYDNADLACWIATINASTDMGDSVEVTRNLDDTAWSESDTLSLVGETITFTIVPPVGVVAPDNYRNNSFICSIVINGTVVGTLGCDYTGDIGEMPGAANMFESDTVSLTLTEDTEIFIEINYDGDDEYVPVPDNGEIGPDDGNGEVGPDDE